MKPRILKMCLLSIIAITTLNAHATKLYKWVDANGNISYQDQPPPKSGKILSQKEIDSKPDSVQKSNLGLPQIVVYSIKDCARCDRQLGVLRTNKIPYIELPLEDDREAQSRILQSADSVIAPTIFIGEKLIQASSEDELRQRLHSAGYVIPNHAK
ncbi:MAG: glutaredoxin [Arenicella sp.]|jgi:glutaredoxin